ncbi:MAG: ParB/RepB/Spo0J family partition protein [Rikenellaceae bacterium]
MIKGITHIDIEAIAPNPVNPRRVFDQVQLDELAASIKELGVLQPITVRTLDEGGYQLVCGERRWRASKQAGLTKIPAIVRKLSDREAMDIAITENLQRSDVSPLEEAEAFDYLLQQGSSRHDLSVRFGVSESYIRNRTQLFNLIPKFRDLVNDNTISMAQAMEIAKCSDEDQKDMFDCRFADTLPDYRSWKDLTARKLQSNIIAEYSFTISRGDFDPKPCAKCISNTSNQELFENDQARCTNKECYKRRQVEALKDNAINLIYNNMELPVYYSHMCNIVTELMAEGIEMIQAQTFYAGYKEGTSEKLIANGLTKAIWVSDSWSRIVLVDNRDHSTSTESLDDLNKKLKREQELFEEKSISDINAYVKRMPLTENQDMLYSTYTCFENNMLTYLMLRKIPDYWLDELLNFAGKKFSYVKPDDLVWDFACELTTGMTVKGANLMDVLRRMLIADFYTDRGSKCLRTVKLFEWVDSFAVSVEKPTETLTQKHKEVMEQRKSRIEAQIAELKK